MRRYGNIGQERTGKDSVTGRERRDNRGNKRLKRTEDWRGRSDSLVVFSWVNQVNVLQSRMSLGGTKLLLLLCLTAAAWADTLQVQ